MKPITEIRKVKLKDVCDRITVGHVGPMADKYTSHGVPFLRSQNIAPFRLNVEDIKYVPREFHEKLRKSALRPGDVAIVRTGYPGTACVIPNEFTELNCADLVVITPSSELNPHYLAAIFNSSWGRASVAGSLVGVAQQHFNVGAAKELEVGLPSRPVQDRIAGILSAYDDLIENSQRRIKILESMARALYREWFVHFRFPGHENHPRAASPLGEIPEGWEAKEMQDVAEVIDCLHSKKPSEHGDGSGILLQLNNIGEDGKLDMSKVFRISDEDYRLWTSRIELRQGDCVVTNVGRVGAVAQIPAGVKVAPGRNMTAIRTRPEKLTPTFLIQYLLSSHMQSEVAKKKDLGTIMDSLNVKGIVRLHVPCPPFATMERYENVARPLRQQIELLIEKNRNLRRTRDLLLPRLLSGQIALDELEAA